MPGLKLDRGPAVTRLFLVDDHHLFLAGVKAELEGKAEIVGIASDVDEAIAADSTDTARRRPDRRPYAGWREG